MCMKGSKYTIAKLMKRLPLNRLQESRHYRPRALGKNLRLSITSDSLSVGFPEEDLQNTVKENQGRTRQNSYQTIPGVPVSRS